jgi:hypothetical protein
MGSREEEKASHQKETIVQACQENHGLENMKKKTKKYRLSSISKYLEPEVFCIFSGFGIFAYT